MSSKFLMLQMNLKLSNENSPDVNKISDIICHLKTLTQNVLRFPLRLNSPHIFAIKKIATQNVTHLLQFYYPPVEFSILALKIFHMAHSCVLYLLWNIFFLHKIQPQNASFASHILHECK